MQRAAYALRVIRICGAVARRELHDACRFQADCRAPRRQAIYSFSDLKPLIQKHNIDGIRQSGGMNGIAWPYAQPGMPRQLEIGMQAQQALTKCLSDEDVQAA